MGRAAARKPTKQSIERPLTKQEAANILGVSTDTLDAWTARYGIAHYKFNVPANKGTRGSIRSRCMDSVTLRVTPKLSTAGGTGFPRPTSEFE